MIILIYNRLIEHLLSLSKYFINTLNPHNNPVVYIYSFISILQKETDAKKIS